MKTKILNTVLIVFALLISVHGNSQDKDKVYIKMEIKGLACPFCAGGMAKAFEKIPGIEQVDMSFEEGLAFLRASNAQKPSKGTLTKIVEEAGFDVGDIIFSDKPFEMPEKKNKSKKNNN